MTKSQLIRLIHVAKREMNIDDDTYRQKLIVATGKDSCRDMSLTELESVYSAFKDSGFKRSFKASKKTVKPRISEHVRTDIILKIRAVWLEMHRHQIVRCGSMAALDQYVQRITASKNGGEGVAHTDWLTGELATHVVETMKKWHIRCIRKQLEAARFQIARDIRGYAALVGFYNSLLNNGSLQSSERVQ